jgi:hypothetical protein
VRVIGGPQTLVKQRLWAFLLRTNDVGRLQAKFRGLDQFEWLTGM